MKRESKEEKQAAKETAKQEKQNERIQKMLAKYGMQDLSDPDDIKSVRNIVTELAGTGMMEFGVTMGGAIDRDFLQLQTYYQRAIVEQNFIMIRQLDRISKKLDEK